MRVKNYILYSNRIDIVDLLGDDAPTELYGLLPLDFKKFIKLKKDLLIKNSTSSSLEVL